METRTENVTDRAEQIRSQVDAIIDQANAAAALRLALDGIAVRPARPPVRTRGEGRK